MGGLVPVFLASKDAAYLDGSKIYFTVDDPTTGQQVTTAAATLFADGSDVQVYVSGGWADSENSVTDVGSGMGLFCLTLTEDELADIRGFVRVSDQSATKLWVDLTLEIRGTEDGGHGKLGDIWEGGNNPVRANIREVYGFDIGKSLYYLVQLMCNYRVNSDITPTENKFTADYLGGRVGTEDDMHLDKTIHWLEGPNEGSTCQVTGYIDSTGQFITTDMVATPVSGNLFLIV